MLTLKELTTSQSTFTWLKKKYQEKASKTLLSIFFLTLSWSLDFSVDKL